MKASVERVPSQEGGAGERRRPKQARSRATEDALLDAGLACIEAVGIEATSMALVAERAGASIGALYFRFGDKERFVRPRSRAPSIASAPRRMRCWPTRSCRTSRPRR